MQSDRSSLISPLTSATLDYFKQVLLCHFTSIIRFSCSLSCVVLHIFSFILSVYIGIHIRSIHCDSLYLFKYLNLQLSSLFSYNFVVEETMYLFLQSFPQPEYLWLHPYVPLFPVFLINWWLALEIALGCVLPSGDI